MHDIFETAPTPIFYVTTDLIVFNKSYQRFSKVSVYFSVVCHEANRIGYELWQPLSRF